MVHQLSNRRPAAVSQPIAGYGMGTGGWGGLRQPAFLTRGLHSSQECNLAQDFPLQRVLVTEGRSRNYGRGSMCALKGKRQARARPAPSVTCRLQTKRRKMLKTSTFLPYAQRPGEKCGLGFCLTSPDQIIINLTRISHQVGELDTSIAPPGENCRLADWPETFPWTKRPSGTCWRRSRAESSR